MSLMLTEYINAAMATAEFEQLEDSTEIYGEIPRCEGLWAVGESEAECREELRSSLEDWIEAKLSYGHDLPAFGAVTVVRAMAATG